MLWLTLYSLFNDFLSFFFFFFFFPVGPTRFLCNPPSFLGTSSSLVYPALDLLPFSAAQPRWPVNCFTYFCSLKHSPKPHLPKKKKNIPTYLLNKNLTLPNWPTFYPPTFLLAYVDILFSLSSLILFSRPPSHLP